MEMLPLLRKNKGTVSSALSKKLAKRALDGEKKILEEAATLITFEKEELRSRGVRSAAAKIVEIIAEERPELVVPHLAKIFPAMEVGEPQTRWMAMRIFGFCAALAENDAARAIPFAERIISGRGGLCLRSSADLFLGDLGAVSPVRAESVFPILAASINNMAKTRTIGSSSLFGRSTATWAKRKGKR